MPGTFDGLPLHPMLVHAVVVLGPLVGVLLIAYAAFPSWRVGLRWPLVGMSLVAAFSAWAAEETGEYLEHHLTLGGSAEAMVETHAEAGELAAIATFVMAAVALVVVLIIARVGQEKLSALGLVLALGATAFLGYAAYNAGHTGATAVWSGTVNSGTTDSGTAEVDDD